MRTRITFKQACLLLALLILFVVVLRQSSQFAALNAYAQSATDNPTSTIEWFAVTVTPEASNNGSQVTPDSNLPPWSISSDGSCPNGEGMTPLGSNDNYDFCNKADRQLLYDQWGEIVDKWLTTPRWGQKKPADDAKYLINGNQELTPSPTPKIPITATPIPPGKDFIVDVPGNRTTVLVGCDEKGQTCVLDDTWTDIRRDHYDWATHTLMRSESRAQSEPYGVYRRVVLKWVDSRWKLAQLKNQIITAITTTPGTLETVTPTWGATTSTTIP